MFKSRFLLSGLLFAQLLRCTGLAQDLYVGSNSSSFFANFPSGVSSFANTYIGVNAGDSNNMLMVINPGTVLANSGSMNVGVQGSLNYLFVYGGARAVADMVQAGGASNSIIAGGPGSVLQATGALTLGGTGAHSLAVSDGASLITSSFAAQSAANTIVIRGPGSLWTNAGALVLGQSGGANSLIVTNAARVFSSGDVVLGQTASSSSNAISVVGADSLLRSSGSIVVGRAGQANSVAVHSGGALEAVSILIGDQAGSSGRLDIGAASGGTSAGMISSSSIDFGAGGGVIAFNQTNAFTLSIPLGGAGSLLQNGTGTTILTGLNTYSGPSVISAGTLQIGNGGTSGTIGSGDITNNSRLVINRSDVYVITNNIYGTGEFIQVGGSITVNGGGGGGSGGGSGGGTSVIRNVMRGTTGLTKTGTGTVILTADNAYTGTTTISGGTLQLGDGGATGSTGAGDIVNNGTLAINRNNLFILGNFITGSGQLRQIGTGTTVMTGSNNYTGQTTISAGALVVNGSATSSSFVVESNGVLSGHRSVGPISGSGLVDPGYRVGILQSPVLDASGGLDFRFEFSAPSPDYTTPEASRNDVLRLTASNPFVSALNAGNHIDIYFNVLGVAEGSVFTGGFFTDQPLDFASSINGASFRYFAADDSGTTIFGDRKYSLLDPQLGVSVSTVLQTAAFPSGLVNGRVARFEVVPEPSTYALLIMSAAGAFWWARRRGSDE
jgi:autotransporter-associated beta strand protein/T5SS/PEP-CTERM-associated repeat protein